MSIEFTSGFESPWYHRIPGNLFDQIFEKLYGFDAPQEEVIDGAIFTEASEPLTTELNEILLFEPIIHG